MDTVSAGRQAPDFKLLDQTGKEVSLSAFRGKKLLLYFYSKAGTSGCTRQAQAVRDALGDLGGLGVAAAGISPDKPESLGRFDAKHGLGFTLLSDPDKAAAKAYGAFGMKNMYGKQVEGIIRSAILIDEKGRVLQAWYKIKPEDTVPKVMDFLKQ